MLKDNTIEANTKESIENTSCLKIDSFDDFVSQDNHPFSSTIDKDKVETETSPSSLLKFEEEKIKKVNKKPGGAYVNLEPNIRIMLKRTNRVN